MVTVNNWLNYTVGCNTNFESDVLCCLVAAYNLGMKNKDKKHLEICLEENCGDFVDFSGTERGREIVKDLVESMNTQLKRHDEDVVKASIKNYCKLNNIEYDELKVAVVY